jgi:hypothetical protein
MIIIMRLTEKLEKTGHNKNDINMPIETQKPMFLV